MNQWRDVEIHRKIRAKLAVAYFTRRLVSPTGCNSEKHRVGTRNLESELAGAYFPRTTVVQEPIKNIDFYR